jgi:hypothetical protein
MCKGGVRGVVFNCYTSNFSCFRARCGRLSGHAGGFGLGVTRLLAANHRLDGQKGEISLVYNLSFVGAALAGLVLPTLFFSGVVGGTKTRSRRALGTARRPPGAGGAFVVERAIAV